MAYAGRHTGAFIAPLNGDNLSLEFRYDGDSHTFVPDSAFTRHTLAAYTNSSE